MDKLVIRGTEINVQWDLKRDDFLSLTDIAKIKDSDNPRYIIQNWLRNRNTIEFLAAGGGRLYMELGCQPRFFY